jgi:transcriptional regulator GlxA family with amidase domain
MTMEIAILLYDNMTALDAIGPYEVLSRVPGADVRFVGTSAGLIRADEGLGLRADVALDDAARPDIVLVPGSSDPRQALADDRVLGWIRASAATATWTTSVCSGSLLLAASGILRGRRATSHWMAMDTLASMGAIPVAERIVVDGSIMTAAGVSAGIDMALRLAALLSDDETAQALQLAIEYEPEPPYAITARTAAAPMRERAILLIG